MVTVMPNLVVKEIVYIPKTNIRRNGHFEIELEDGHREGIAITPGMDAIDLCYLLEGITQRLATYVREKK